jgi:cell wall-associated NlpC family hydrolase
VRPLLIAIPISLLAACAAPPRGVTVRTAPKPSVAAPPAAAVQSEPPAARSVVASAEQFLGTPYAYGGMGARGVDCSGLVKRVYAEHGVRLPRTSAEQYRVGASVERTELKPGDLVFFGAQGRASHVGIYAGEGSFIHASTSSLRVQRDDIDQSYFRRRFLGARRILD